MRHKEDSALDAYPVNVAILDDLLSVADVEGGGYCSHKRIAAIDNGYAGNFFKLWRICCTKLINEATEYCIYSFFGTFLVQPGSTDDKCELSINRAGLSGDQHDQRKRMVLCGVFSHDRLQPRYQRFFIHVNTPSMRSSKAKMISSARILGLLPTGLYLNSSVHAVTRDQLVNSLGFTAFAASNLRCNPARRIRSSSLCVLNDRDISPVSG